MVSGYPDLLRGTMGDRIRRGVAFIIDGSVAVIPCFINLFIIFLAKNPVVIRWSTAISTVLYVVLMAFRDVIFGTRSIGNRMANTTVFHV